jgi:hypothetical protein
VEGGRGDQGGGVEGEGGRRMGAEGGSGEREEKGVSRWGAGCTGIERSEAGRGEGAGGI